MKLGLNQAVNGIDLRLAPPRTLAKLRLDFVFEDGSPVNRVSVKLIPASGADRNSFSSDKNSSSLELNVYAGETYTIKASHSQIEGRRIRDWENLPQTITITTPDTQLRIAMVEKPKR
ncbi:MAG: hypothetical protein HY820_12365 [Acidobacteria bacterium]|nr:hypothetical protein [Acidobacteriota bacterium]